MIFIVYITVFGADDGVISMHEAELDTLPSPQDLELLTLVVMADGKKAVATVHLATHPTVPLYGIISETCNGC